MMTILFSKLFSSLKIGSLSVPNRAVLPGLTSNFSGENGEVTEQLIGFLRKRAEGGAGLIFVESVFVDWSGKGTPRELGIHDDSLIPGLKRLTAAIHETGAKIMPQLIHCGRQMTSAFSKMPLLAPSPIPDPVVGEMPKEMTIDEIHWMVERFAKAAKRAKDSGFDGVEIQAGHGYLISQFLSPYANKRTDQYGGSLDNRIRFLQQIIMRTREIVGSDFPIVCRINADEYVEEGIHLEEAIQIAIRLEKLGADAIDVSVSVKESYHFLSATSGESTGNQAHFAQEIKKNVSIPVITAGRIITPELAEEILQEGQADLVAIGRAMIADPDFIQKASQNRMETIIPCIGCNACNARSHRPQTLCLVNSEVGREYVLEEVKSISSMHVGIVGSSLAGLEAAKIAALNAHQVTILEPTNRLGGLLGGIRFRVPGQQELAKSVHYFSTVLEELGVNIMYNASITESNIVDQHFDLLYVALQGDIQPIYENVDATYAINLLTEENLEESSYTIIGNGILAAETALFVASQGKQVALVYDHPNIVHDAHPTIRYYNRKRLEKLEVSLIQVQKITSETFQSYKNVIQTHNFNEEKTENKYCETAKKVIFLGDAYEASDLAERVWRAGDTAILKGVHNHE
jgi:2,4-dienoyl-CoA reductase-like NADH-dependent reductase (Old Yellow Enzyme family)